MKILLPVIVLLALTACDSAGGHVFGNTEPGHVFGDGSDMRTCEHYGNCEDSCHLYGNCGE